MEWQSGAGGSFRKRLLLSTIFALWVFYGGSGCFYRQGCFLKSSANFSRAALQPEGSGAGSLQALGQWPCSGFFNTAGAEGRAGGSSSQRFSV